MRIVFFGASELGYHCCEKILAMKQNVVGIFTMPRIFNISYSPDKPVNNILHRDFYELGDKHGIPVVCVEKKMIEYRDTLSSMHPDLILVIGWYYMIPKSIRDIAPLGCAGIHSSLLPKYRGGAPLVWAIINGEKEAGVSFFYMDEGVDTGDIIGQGAFSIEETDTIREVLLKAENAALHLLEEFIPKMAEGTAPRVQQNHNEASIFHQRTPEDGLIDWTWEKEKIQNFIRAQTRPYPGAYTIIGDKKVTIWDAKIEAY